MTTWKHKSFLALVFLLSQWMLQSEKSFALVSDFSILGGITSSGYHYDTSLNVNVTRKLDYGLGALVGLEASRFITVETGILYLRNSFNVTQANLSEDRKLDFFDLALMMRFVPVTPIAFYIGTYYGVETGSSITDYGVLGGLGYRYSITNNLKLRIDGYYQFGLAHLDSTQNSQSSRNWIGLAGLMFETW